MFNKNKDTTTKVSSADFDTVIGESTLFEGNIKSTASLRVDGKVVGDLITEGAVHIGKTGEVNGKIKAQQIYLAGKIKGNIEAKEVLRITSSGKLMGDGDTKTLIVDENGVFDGKSKMLSSTDSKDSSASIDIEPPQKTKQKKES